MDQSVPHGIIELDPRTRLHIRRAPQKRRVRARRTGRHEVQNRRGGPQGLREIEGQVVNFVLVDFAVPVQFVSRRALKLPFCFPRNSRHAFQVPSDQYDILRRLPNSENLQRYVSEQNLAMKSQCPEDQFVLLNTTKRVQWIQKRYIISAYILYHQAN